MSNDFKDFFKQATNFYPFPYQVRTSDETRKLPNVLQVPTGTGKTAAAILAWLWRRETRPSETPRRLVYCLPMRVLVQQTRSCALLWLHRLRLLAGKVDLDEGDCVRTYEPAWGEPNKTAVATLMGGETDDKWREYPENEVILVGTQDMLLSRALNRGYAAWPSEWPVEFGLLNVDTLWVMDEVQLMGPARTTSVQLQLFSPDRGTASDYQKWPNRQTLWMSATLGAKQQSLDPPGWMRTSEWGSRQLESPVEGARGDGSKDQCDLLDEEFADRWRAPKRLESHIRSAETATQHPQRRRSKKMRAQTVCDVSWTIDSLELIDCIVREATSKPRQTVLVFVNRVDRARDLFRAIESSANNVELLLLHSRFRPKDRSEREERLMKETPLEGRVVVSTQVLEAGVDLDAQVLFTEVCPWPSLVQRLGRLNRRGKQKVLPARAVVFDVPLPVRKDNESESDYRDRARKEGCLPYVADDLDATREHMRSLERNGGNLSPETLSKIEAALPIAGPVLRRFDLDDFFDTDPDLAGGHTDVSPYVRALDRDVDAYVLWRRLELEPDKQPPIHPDELCPVAFYDVRKAFAGKTIWILTLATRKGQKGAWRRARVDDVQPGDTVMVDIAAGCYTEEAGWLGQGNSDQRPDFWVDRWDRIDDTPVRAWARKDSPSGLQFGKVIDDRVDANRSCQEDRRSFTKHWMELDLHNREAERHATVIVEAIGLRKVGGAVKTAARWHDVGKALERKEESGSVVSPFQNMLRSTGVDEDGHPENQTLYAKSNRSGGKPSGFRHEVASALAYLSLPDADDLVAYLILAHMGKVRMLPIPWEDDNPTDANGVQPHDRVPVAALPAGTATEPLLLDPELFLPTRSHPGWQGRVARLLKELGPFGLAYLEALVRVADWRAS